MCHLHRSRRLPHGTGRTRKAKAGLSTGTTVHETISPAVGQHYLSIRNAYGTTLHILEETIECGA